jgi:hypothetical protein
MMPQEENKELKQIHWIPAPGGVLEIYANMATLQWSMDDVRVRVAQMINSPETPDPNQEIIPIAQEKAAVTISWRGAKIMRDYLIGAIEGYEKVNGNIVVDVKLPSSRP